MADRQCSVKLSGFRDCFGSEDDLLDELFRVLLEGPEVDVLVSIIMIGAISFCS